MWGRIIRQLVEQTRRNAVMESEDIVPYPGPEGTRLRLREPRTQTTAAPLPGSSGSGDYSGPFAVVDSSYVDETDPQNPVGVPQVTILGHNATEGRNWYNYIDVGLNTPLELAECDVAVSAAGWIYMTLTQSGNVYQTPTAAFAATLPTQDNTHEYIRLAYVGWDSGAISEVVQWVYGGIARPGRIY